MEAKAERLRFLTFDAKEERSGTPFYTQVGISEGLLAPGVVDWVSLTFYFSFNFVLQLLILIGLLSLLSYIHTTS